MYANRDSRCREWFAARVDADEIVLGKVSRYS